MQIYVYSRRGLEAARPHEVPHIIISITSSPHDIAYFRPNETCAGILRLAFPDSDAPSELFRDEDLFSSAHATEIWNFVLQYQARVQRIIIHCDAGYSRSPAVAAAIVKVLNGNDEEYFAGRYSPNLRVYRTMLETYEKVASKTEAL